MVFGGQSSEHDVSCVSAANVIDGLREDKYDIYRIGITKEGKWLFVEDTDSIRDGSWVEGTVTEIGRASCRERCRSRWSPYH